MTTTCRTWWRNCALHSDSEIDAIDNMEDRFAPIGDGASRIRELIAGLELCHHKSDRWIENIVEAIGTGETTKGLGTRPPDQKHPQETVWQKSCEALTAWCAGHPEEKDDLLIGTIPSSQLFTCLGKRTPLKEWQVKRLIEKIGSMVQWSRSSEDSEADYEWLLLSVGEYEFSYRDQCPEKYKDHEDYWLQTARTIIHDTENGDEADLSLALAIDMLWPCHWRFVENLQIVLEAIGGKLRPETPFAACGRNITIRPNQHRMEVISNTLKSFCSDAGPDQEVDEDVLMQLGNPTEIKRWLAASLDKTIRLQLDPPTEVRALSSMAGPDWL